MEVLKSGSLVQGAEVKEFEDRFAAFVGSRHAVAVNSGTAALHTALRSLAIGPGDEVILPAITFFSCDGDGKTNRCHQCLRSSPDSG